ncbi:MAG: sulfotransferase [Pseudomonadota bacterium]
MQNSHIHNPALEDGLKKLSRRDYKDVHARAIEMIKRNVEDPVPYFLLGIIAIDHGNVVKAASLFESASAYDLGSSLYRAHQARALTLLNQQAEACAIAEAASALPMMDAHTADTLGVVFSRTGFHERAIPLFEKAVSLDPRPANFHYNLGSSRQFIGDFEGAEAAYLATLEREPAHFRAWSSLVSLSKQTTETHRLAALEGLFANHEDQADARLHFGHALAKSHEDLGAYEQSLEWLKRAKTLKRSGLAYDVSGDLALFDAAKRTTDRPNRPAANASDAAPIFIIGLPRTGTTLVDRILSSHSQVTSAGELNTFAGLIKHAAGSPSNLVLGEETLQAAQGLDLAAIGRDYIDATASLARGAPRFTDKMPLNFFYAGLIHRALPNARIVALRRGAMDSCLSNYRQLFSTGFSYYNYTFDLADTAAYYRAFDALMAHWREALPANRFIEVRYEDVVFEQERETRRLLEFCELDWDDACLRFHENAAPVSTASSVQVRQPLYSGSIGRWKRYGGALDGLKDALGDLAHS